MDGNQKGDHSGLMIPRRLDGPRTANTLMKYYPMSHTISLHLSRKCNPYKRYGNLVKARTSYLICANATFV